MSGGEGRLIEAFIVSAATEVGDKMTPVMMFCFAPEDAHLMQYKPVPDFSFPDPQQLKPGGLKSPTSATPDRKDDRETFVFTLTDKDSNRLYGFCRRYSAAAGSSVEVACILTKHSWYDTFTRILDVVEDTATGPKGAYGVSALMKAVTAAGLPHPGQLLHIPVTGIHPSAHTLSVERPVNTSRCTYDRRLCVLFRSMVVSKIVMLFFLMLTERRIILMSAHPSVLSDCAHALASLLYPFEWQHIYVPILVPKMIDYVCAPMPFLIGMHISMLPQLKSQPMEEVVMVDLDRGRLRYNEKDIQHLPDEHFDSMVNSLQASLEARSGDDSQDWAPLANVFLDFFLAVFSNYRRFVHAPEARAPLDASCQRASSVTFDNDAFVKSHRKNITKFLREFERSQMYEVFFYERSAAAFRAAEGLSDPFELAVIAVHGPDPGGHLPDEVRDRCGSGSAVAEEGQLHHSQEKEGEKKEGGGGKKSMMRGFLGAMSSMSDQMSQLGFARESTGETYRPTYLREEAGYVKSKHLLMRIYRDVGMLGYAGMNGKVMDKASSPPIRDEAVWREEWFGPSAARWAMQPTAKSKNGTAPPPSANVEWTDEELERQTRYFQELNDQRRAADEAAAAAAASAAVPAPGAPPSAQTEISFQDAARADEHDGGDGANGACGQEAAMDMDGSGLRLGPEEVEVDCLDREANPPFSRDTRKGGGGTEMLEPALEDLLQQHGLSHLRSTLEAQEIVDLATVAELSGCDWQEMGLHMEMLEPLVVSARRALDATRGRGSGQQQDADVIGSVVASGLAMPVMDLSEKGGGWCAHAQEQTAPEAQDGRTSVGGLDDETRYDREKMSAVDNWVTFETDEEGGEEERNRQAQAGELAFSDEKVGSEREDGTEDGRNVQEVLGDSSRLGLGTLEEVKEGQAQEAGASLHEGLIDTAQRDAEKDELWACVDAEQAGDAVAGTEEA